MWPAWEKWLKNVWRKSKNSLHKSEVGTVILSAPKNRRRQKENGNVLKKVISAQFQFYFLRLVREAGAEVRYPVFTSSQYMGRKLIYLNNQGDCFWWASMAKEKNSSVHTDGKCPVLYLNDILDQMYAFHQIFHPWLQMWMPRQWWTLSYLPW